MFFYENNRISERISEISGLTRFHGVIIIFDPCSSLTHEVFKKFSTKDMFMKNF